MIPAAIASILLAVLISNSIAYPSFQQKIPNGEIVPNPCNRSAVWPGVGHKNKDGAGPRNPFGLDFKANDLVWNRTLCEKDSDGDGLTNGQELGDPNCIWTQGSIPTVSTNLSHPGICEPVGSRNCISTNSWLTECTPAKFDCPSINDADVRNYTLRFPETTIPSQETTYICHRFTLPNDSVADIVALEPLIIQGQNVHHMLLFGCTSEPLDMAENESYICGTTPPQNCPTLIGVWFIGYLGQCLNNQFGFRIGPGGFQYVLLQIHWNNPQLTTDLKDSSGMRMYYTTRLRPNVGTVARIGQIYMEIPPGKDEVIVSGSCTSACTRKLAKSRFVAAIDLHMHVLGKAGNVTVFRNGSAFRNLVIAPQYDSNTPERTEFDPPFEWKPGDEFRVTCVYQSTNRNFTTYYGEATTTQEMCLAFVTYYPADNSPNFCGQWKGIGVCNSKEREFGSCEFIKFLYYLASLNTSCAESCSASNCTMLLDALLANDCMNYTDVTSYSQTFLYSYYALFLRCSSSKVSSGTTTSFDITTTLSLNTSLSSYNTLTSTKSTTSASNYTPERSSHNTLDLNNSSTTTSPNHSSERKAVFAHIILFSLVVYATCKLTQ